MDAERLMTCCPVCFYLGYVCDCVFYSSGVTGSNFCQYLHFFSSYMTAFRFLDIVEIGFGFCSTFSCILVT